MDTLDDTSWDVLIVGTGLQQSLLALALSRSGKQVLHVDKNDYYGGAEAAFSLQEATDWVERNKHHRTSSTFKHVAAESHEAPKGAPKDEKLGFSRGYSLSLAPQLIYTRSKLLSALVSSKVYRQLEFQAVGSWWIYSGATLAKVPNGREDLFADSSLDLRAKRSLLKFLKFIGKYEENADLWEKYRHQPLPIFLEKEFTLPAKASDLFLAITLTPDLPSRTTTSYALPRIARHLRSIGVFGPGFGSVIPRWGGLAEISQVACRAGAVGGAVYVLGKGVKNMYQETDSSKSNEEGVSTGAVATRVCLTDDEKIQASWVAVSSDDTIQTHSEPASDAGTMTSCRSISIVSSQQPSLFPSMSSDVPPPAGTVVVFPSSSIVPQDLSVPAAEIPPVYIMAHSFDTGECPAGQCVLYSSTSLTGDQGRVLLDAAISRLLSGVAESQSSEPATTHPKVLWQMTYEQHGLRPSGGDDQAADGQQATDGGPEPDNGGTERRYGGGVLQFPPPSLDLAFNDDVVQRVKRMWKKITGAGDEEFMRFEDRPGEGEGVGNDEYFGSEIG